MVYKWAMAIDKGLVSRVVLLDLRKASVCLTAHIVLLEMGIPEGSILGPIFFIAFTNDKRPLSNRTEHTVDIYADDSTIRASGEPVRSTEHTLNSDLQKICSWCGEKRMVINAKKKGHDYHDSTKVPTPRHN